MLSVVMYVFRVSISLFCGYPKSMISGWEVNYKALHETRISLAVNQLVDENKVILDGFFVYFAKIRFRNRDEAITKFEYQGRIGVTPIKRSKLTAYNRETDTIYFVTATT